MAVCPAVKAPLERTLLQSDEFNCDGKAGRSRDLLLQLRKLTVDQDAAAVAGGAQEAAVFGGIAGYLAALVAPLSAGGVPVDLCIGANLRAQLDGDFQRDRSNGKIVIYHVIPSIKV